MSPHPLSKFVDFPIGRPKFHTSPKIFTNNPTTLNICLFFLFLKIEINILSVRTSKTLDLHMIQFCPRQAVLVWNSSEIKIEIFSSGDFHYAILPYPNGSAGLILLSVLVIFLFLLGES